MKKILLALVTAVFALGVMSHGAEAAKKKTQVTVTPWGWGWNGTTWVWTGPWTVRDPRLAASNLVVGAGATGAYFALRHGTTALKYGGGHHGVHSAGFAYGATAIGCAAVSPIIGTLWVNRPLTTREVFVSTANCALPFVGGWVMNAWFDQNGWK